MPVNRLIKRVIFGFAFIVIVVILGIFAGGGQTVHAEQNSCGVVVDIVAAPFVVVDSNMPGVEGPKVAMVGARISNPGATTVSNLVVAIGDGLTPGAFPTNSGGQLQLLADAPASYYLNDLMPGETKAVYWPVTYPFTYDETYAYTVWAATADGCLTAEQATLTTQSEISALANKLLPTGSQLTVTPQTAVPGSLLKVRITGFELGTIGQGPKPLAPYDAWLQPVGNLDFDPSCLRLVKSEVLLNSINSVPVTNQLYFSGIRSYVSHPNDYAEYTFLPLQVCDTTIQPYQEAASGTQEKYNGDYSDSTSRIQLTVSGNAELVMDMVASSETARAGETVMLTTTFQTSSGLMGYPDAGSPVILTTAIPADTTYVSGSAELSVAGDVQFSVDGGLTWQLGEPEDVTTVTHIRWILAEPVDANAETTSFAVTFSDQYAGDPTVFTTTVALADAETLASTTAVVNPLPEGALNCQLQSINIAYEDLKNTGWSDWDYNDFVVQIQGDVCLTASGDLARLEMNYEALARGAGFDHQFRHALPISGGGQASLVVKDGAGNIVSQWETAFAETADFVIFNRTLEALPPDPAFDFTNTQPGQTFDIAGYTATLLVELTDPAANPEFLLPPFPWDPYLEIYNTGENVHLLIPGHLDNSQQVNNVYDAVTPLLGYDMPLAQTFPAEWDWPMEYLGLWRGYPNYVGYLNSGGMANVDWYHAVNAVPQWIWRTGRGQNRLPMVLQSPEVTSRYFAAPVAADLDQKGKVEIILSNMLQNRLEVYNNQLKLIWTVPVGGEVKAAPVVVDLTGDGWSEIVVGASDGYLYAFHHDGTAVSGWPVFVGGTRILSTPAVADLDGDNQPEIAVSLANGRLYLLNHDGSLRWDASLGDVADAFNSQVLNSSPVMADLDGDQTLEIVVGSYDQQLYAFSDQGDLLWHFATSDIIIGTPTVADIVPDVVGLETAVGSGDGYLYVLDATGNLIWKRNSGWVIRSSPLVVDMDPTTPGLEIVISRDSNGQNGLVLAWHHDGRLVSGWPQKTGGNVLARPVWGDVDGDQQPEIVVAGEDAQVYAWEMDGTLVSGWPRETAVSVKASPELVNLDGDVALEVVVNDFAGGYYAWDLNFNHVFLPLIVSP